MNYIMAASSPPPSPFSAPSPLKKTVYKGTFIHTPTLGVLEVLEDAAVGVDEEGRIVFIDRGGRDGGDGRGVEQEKEGWEGCEVVGCDVGDGRKGEGFWFPGFVGEFVRLFVLFSCYFCCCFLLWRVDKWKRGWGNEMGGGLGCDVRVHE